MGSLLKLAENYITKLFASLLPQGMYFHNLKHTKEVVSVSRKIGKGSGLDNYELELLQLAAWFHDSGYCFVYEGHENESILIATGFLKDHNLPNEYVSKISRLIDATRMPQKPGSLMEQIICDADLAHLSKLRYPLYARSLRLEWETKLNRKYSDREWLKTNLALMMTHHYFTAYATMQLEPGKQNNARLLAASYTNN